MKRMVAGMVTMAVLLLSAAVVKASVLTVDFGGDYVSTSINSAKTVSESNGDFDFDGNTDDRVSSVAFGSVFTAPNNSNWSNLVGKSNGTIYHGVSVAVFDNQAIDPGVSMDRMGDNTPDRFQIGNTKIAGETLSLAVAVYWTEADFLNGTGSLADEADSMSMSLAASGVKPTVHFLVQAGGNWYISADSSGSSFSINGATASWYAFDPTANAMFRDETNPGTAVSGSSLGNITAAGVYGQTDDGYDGATGSLFGMDGLQVSVVPPAPPLPVETAIDFGGDYVSASANSSKIVAQSNGDFDFDGTADDRVSAVSFGQLFSSPNSPFWTDIPGKSNGDIYHGISVGLFNNQTLDPADPMDRIGDSPAGDRFQMGNVKITGETMSLAVAVYWNSTNFLNGGHAAPLGNATNSMSVSLVSTGIKPRVHFLVQAGGSWYISADSNDGNFGINGATASWYAFDPTANAMFWDESSPGIPVVGSSLGDITAAGVYGQTDDGYDGATGSLFGMDGLQVLVEAAQTNAAPTYSEWLSGYSVGSLTNLTDDYDGDLMNNLVEYGLGGDPTTSDAAAVLPVCVLESNVMTYIYNRRLNANDRGLTYIVGKDTDLVSTPDGWTTNGVTEVGSGAIDLEFESVTNTAPVDVDAKFLRLQIELAE
jgi:hypothetical protein